MGDNLPPISIDAGRCSGCGRCVSACPKHLFALEVTGNRKTALFRSPARCDRCGRCIDACPFGALSLSGRSPV